jgi:ferric-dicitrate binding protein FerR (iron transport regulator)
MRSAWILGRHEAGKLDFDADSGWPVIEQHLANNRKLRFAGWMTPLRYAASLALCMGLTAGVMWLTRGTKVIQGAESVVYSNTTIQMPLGSKSNVTLPDGSSVWLNAGSTLTYPADFGLDTRELQLVGEAFFDVKSDSLMPFLVHTVGMTVRAKGTRFNVKAYPDDEMMAATLEEGKLDVLIQATEKAPSQNIELRPNQQFVILKSQQKNMPEEKSRKMKEQQPSIAAIPKIDIKEGRLISNVQTKLSTSWKDTHWVITDEPLYKFVADLERRYNLDIHFDSEELKNYKFTGTFENETVEQIFTAISMTAPVNYRFNKNQVILSLNKTKIDKFNQMVQKNNHVKP